MNVKKHVVVIGGGEAWNTKKEYLTYLHNYTFTQEKFDKMVIVRWKQNLQKDLGDRFCVITPHMPNPRDAKYTEWDIWFSKILPYITDDAVFIGHSLGANFLAKYLAENTLTISLAQLHLVAGCFGCAGGFTLSQNLQKVEDVCKEIYIYHSHDDNCVDFADAQKYKKSLPKAELITFEDRGHFRQTHFPEIVDNIKKSV